MNRTKLLSFIFAAITTFSFSTIQAQKVLKLNLDQAIHYAYKNNFSMLSSDKDLEIARQQLKETLATGLPQISGSVSYHDNVARPVSLIPGEIIGEPGTQIPIQFGTRYDATVSGQFSQLIFDGRYIVGLKAAKVAIEKADRDFFKNKLAVREQVSKAYYQVLSIEKSLHIVDSTFNVTSKLAKETNHVYKEGLTDDVSVDQLNLLVSNLEATKTRLSNQQVIARAFLKFYLGLNDKDSVVLTENMNSLVTQKEKGISESGFFNLDNNINYQSVQTAKEISKLQVMLAKAAYLPTINASVSYNTQAQRNTWNFFNDDKWYQSAIIGVTMHIPIFSSGNRKAILNQAKLNFEKMEIMEKETGKQLNIQYKTLINDYENAKKVYVNKDQNRKIAEKIYNKTMEKFRQGMASSLDLLNVHNQFLNAESDYVTAEFDLLQSAEALQTLLTKAQ
ncbi:MAG: TolC family protein [Bacteroidales bacterium]|nr:TolC family protein [Bacteroidales bacterium]